MNIAVIDTRSFASFDVDSFSHGMSTMNSVVTVVDEAFCMRRNEGERSVLRDNCFCVGQRIASKKSYLYECMQRIVNRGENIFVDISTVDISYSRSVMRVLHRTIAGADKIPALVVIVCRKIDVIKVARTVRDVFFVSDLNMRDEEILRYVKKSYILGGTLRVVGGRLLAGSLFVWRFLHRKLR